MSTLRFEALRQASARKPVKFEESDRKSNIFGANVFNEKAMKQFLTEDAFKGVRDAVQHGIKIDRKLAEYIAMGMKEWALSKNVTHYTHWFQPLTGTTAEKHDSFFETDFEGGSLEKFGGGQLVQQEPDASSFPNGGIRNTFEARGYTAWDPTSPAFIFGTTLCIPTVFISYTGEALDYKTPLLRALHAIDEAATDVCRYFDKNVKKVTATLGWEQEYFLIDTALANSRPDILLTGRTLLGHTSAKGQQLDDHYFGSIPSRVLSYMRELEEECMYLGIPVKTRHNEVAPNQFELAPIFEETNLAVDHNSLLMDVMQKVGERHDFKVLFHEKPFKGVNGSGKHNNWSMATDTGVNLLGPGKTPMSNLQFLTFFINTIKAVNNYEALLRGAIATASNDHRLGANEAPPAIISVFIGQQLTKVLAELEGVSNGKLSPEEKTDLGSQLAGDLAGRLSAAGFTVDRQTLYEARKAGFLSPETVDALRHGTIDAVTFFSPRTASAFVTLCQEAGLLSALAPIAAVCLSEAVADAAREATWRAVIVAARPDQAALLDALEAMTSGEAAGPWDPEANLPAFSSDSGARSHGEDRLVTYDSAGPSPLPPTLLGPSMADGAAKEDAAAKEAKAATATTAPAKPQRKRSPVLWTIAGLLVLLIAFMVIWPSQVRRLVATVVPPRPPVAAPPSASIAVAPPNRPAATTPPAAVPAPPANTAAPPASAPSSSLPAPAAPPAASSPAPTAAIDLESRLNAVESRVAALLEQPVVTPESLAGVLAEQRRATDDSARAAAEAAARSVAKDTADAAVKAASAGQSDTAAALADLERRLAAVEKASAALSGMADLEKRLASMEKAATAFAALADLERRTSQLEKSTATSAAAASQTAARGDTLTLGLLALRDALDRGAPFGDELSALRVAASGDGVLVAEADRLAPMAVSGVASLTVLRQSLADLARADAAAPVPAASPAESAKPDSSAATEEPSSILSEVWHKLTSAVVIRRLDQPAASGAANDPADRASLFAGAQTQLAAGDLAGAVAKLDDEKLRDALAEPQRAALATWLRDARARLTAETSFGVLSRRALAIASAQSAATPAAPAAVPAP